MTPDIRRIRVLAVDDVPEDCALNKAILSHAGFTVDTACSLKEARALLERDEYGVLLLDLRMPDGSGLDLVEAAHARNPHAVVLVLTAFGEVESAVAAVRAHAYDFLTKPCPSQRLLSAVGRAAEKYLLSRALEDRSRELEAVNRDLDRRVRDATLEIFGLNEKLKRTVSELTEASAQQTRFLEDMAHELKNPLSVIWGYASFLLRRPMGEWTPEELKRSLESVQRNAQHIQSMIEELLDSTRLDARKITLTRQPVRAADAVREVVEGLRSQAQDRGLTLAGECQGGADLQAFADVDRLRQILVNLVSNALKFTPRGGRITVRASREGTHARFCVEDTGKGLRPEDARRVFDRFYQVDGPERQQGLGLGLHIVHGLVRLHEGRVWVESEPGKGSRFNFVLPCSQKDKVAGSEAAPAADPTIQALRTNPN